MAIFSQRYGYSNDSGLQLESVDDVLKRRIWNKFYGAEFDLYDVLDLRKALTNIEIMMDKMGVVYQYPGNVNIKQKNADELQKHLLNSDKWYLVYDFVEKYLELFDDDEKNAVIIEYNKLLEEEVSGYRIINGLITPIVSESEIQAIDEATKTPYDAVNIHLSKALSLFTNRKNPDFKNSIKESISAVEALCKIIVGDDKTTLGQALKKLEANGIELHSALKNAFENLYGYTSDAKGIRHAGIDYKNSPSEDAKFMLVTCSAFVNYLVEKLEKSTKVK